MAGPGAAPRGLGRCRCCFWLAVSFDAVGLSVLLLGLFASVPFSDLLLYAGAIVLFVSLVWWVFWYSGNIEVPPAELEDDVGLRKKNRGGVSAAVRRLSSRLTSSIRRTAVSTSPPGGPVTVSMATLPPRDGGARAVTDCDVEMPRTASESSAT